MALFFKRCAQPEPARRKDRSRSEVNLGAIFFRIIMATAYTQSEKTPTRVFG
jgi:hypothetical protein